MLFFYIRHGDPVYEPDSLTPLGRRQAEAVGRRLARYGLDEIYMSSSERAMETAKPVCELLHKDATVLDWTNEKHAWREMTFPKPDGGLTWGFCDPQVRNVFTSREVRNSGDGWMDHPIFEGTTFVQGYLRIRCETRALMERLGFAWDDEKGQYRNLAWTPGGQATDLAGKRVALFAHHGFGMSFLSSVLDIPYPDVCIRMNISHSGLTVIHFPEKDEYVIPEMLCLGNDGHLLAENLPTCYNNLIRF